MSAVRIVAALALLTMGCSTNGNGEPSGRIDPPIAPHDAGDDAYDAKYCTVLTPDLAEQEICPCAAGSTVGCATCCGVQITFAACADDGLWRYAGGNATLCGCAGDPGDCLPDGGMCDVRTSSCPCTPYETYSCSPDDARTYWCDGGTWGPLCEAPDAASDASADAPADGSD